MKLNIVISILLLTYCSHSQEAPFYQNDSVYRVNNVKEMEVIYKNAPLRTDFFNKKGKIIKSVSYTSEKYKYDSKVKLTKYSVIDYKYDLKGKLIKYYETIINQEIYNRNFEVVYFNNKVLKINCYDYKGELQHVSNYINSWKKRINESYKKGKIDYSFEVDYIDSLNIQKYSRKFLNGYEKNTGENKYSFKNNLINKIIEYRDGKKGIVSEFNYQENKLVKKITYRTNKGYLKYHYKYKYYKPQD